MYERILIPIDGGSCSEEATAHGLAVAKAMGASVVFLFAMDTLSARQEGVVNMAEARQALKARGRDLLDGAARTAADAGVPCAGELVEDTPVDAIVGRSGDFDLLVMGSHGRGILRRLTVGSVTQAVLHRIKKPLLVVRCHPAEEHRHSVP